MSAIANSFVPLKSTHTHFFSDKCIVSNNLLPILSSRKKEKSLKSRSLVMQASGDGGRASTASIFVGGFVLGGLVVGALGCIYAPQISKALAETDTKDLMRKLPKFIYDEEKALERTRKILTEKIDQLNAAIDDISSQLRGDDPPNGSAASPDELEASR